MKPPSRPWRQDLRPDYSFGKAIWEPALKEAGAKLLSTGFQLDQGMKHVPRNHNTNITNQLFEHILSDLSYLIYFCTFYFRDSSHSQVIYGYLFMNT